jgi:hypothetical protein
MRIVFAAVLFIAAGLFAQSATADPMTVGQLQARCAKLDLSEHNEVKLRSASIGDALDAGKCWGHLEAYLDLATITLPEPGKSTAIHPIGACAPFNFANFTLVAKLFLRYAETHPAEHQKPAAQVIAELLAQRFPCPK